MHRYKKNRDPIDHMLDLETMREMEELLPMTLSERKSLHSWVYNGNDPEKNPWGYCDKDGWLKHYLEAYRYHHGYRYHHRYEIIEE